MNRRRAGQDTRPAAPASAVGAARRLQALAEIGWPITRCGATRTAFKRLEWPGRCDTVRVRRLARRAQRRHVRAWERAQR